MSETREAMHLRVYKDAKAARSSLENYWQDLMYYCLPRKAYITRLKSMGDRIPVDIYDSTAIMAAAYFAAGMQAYMSGPQTQWFDLIIKNRKLMNNKEVLDYLSDTKDALYDIINGSNFYQEDVEGYLNHGVIGTDILYIEEDLETTVRFECMNIEDIVILANYRGVVDTAYVEYEFDAKQAVGKFGNKVGEKVLEAYRDSKFTVKFKYLFCVHPREVYDISKKDALNMPFQSLWIDEERQVAVSEKGYREFPFCVSRFTKSKGDPYGYSPAMNVFPDITMINQMEYTNIMGAQNAVAPPLEIPDEVFIRPFNFNPRGKNIKMAGYPNEHITPIITGANVPLALDYVQYKQGKVQQAFYNDLFVLLEKIGDQTATEAMIRNTQRMQLLGSAVGNIMTGKLSPVINRVYSIAALQNKLPPRPGILANEDYQEVYRSPLARAQKALELQNVQQAMAIIGSVAPIDIKVLDKLNLDEFVDYIAEITNITPKIIRSDAEVEEIREGRAQQEAVAMQLEMMQKGIDITKGASEADKNISEAQAPAGVR